MLPIGGDPGERPIWSFDGNLEAPTLSPSILTRLTWSKAVEGMTDFVCHSFLRGGVFEFLDDCTHQYKGQHVPLPDLPDWVLHDEDRRHREGF